jgi:hypothetical protein
MWEIRIQVSKWRCLTSCRLRRLLGLQKTTLLRALRRRSERRCEESPRCKGPIRSSKDTLRKDARRTSSMGLRHTNRPRAGRCRRVNFEAARIEVDQFVRSYASKSAEQLVAVHVRMQEGTAESFSHALTSCRRLIASVADAVFPAQAAPYIDSSGRKHGVGGEL